MTSEELQQLIESNAKAIEALATQQTERQRHTDRQIAELTRTVSTFVRETSDVVSNLMNDRATMYELISQNSEAQASINESLSQIAEAISRIADKDN
ncbi:hypothetical protein [Acaryochloris marina]|uniref:Uncharacterized protein n=1 Tax=Acaryochloris marina (strain MBIC 11017) TaxID=329726 RepID=A8ZKZ5_ACAM1|nr:hypothetical protein [Acaryochloris marina]ABW31463.1 hypothetical protein AM1_A0345 [Acaryochloris marina MBIC11017]